MGCINIYLTLNTNTLYKNNCIIMIVTLYQNNTLYKKVFSAHIYYRFVDVLRVHRTHPKVHIPYFVV